MKKSLLAVLCGVILGAALILGACGNSKTKDPQAVLESYLNADEVQEAFESMSESMESMGLKMEMYADGSSIVYKCTYSSTLPDTEAAAESILSSMEVNGDSLAEAVEGIESATGLEGVSMVYEYYDADGNLICSGTFTSEGLVK